MTEPRITDEQLLAFAAGELSGFQAARVEEYLHSNAEAAATVALYRLVQQRYAEDDSVAPSTSAIARVRAIFARHAVQSARTNWLQAVDRLIAKLIFDSRLHTAAVRYADTGQRINLTYQAESAEIDVQAERQTPVGDGDHSERWQLLGQVSPPPASGKAKIALAVQGAALPIAEVQADDRGAFALQAMPGRYDLYVQLDERVVVIPNLDIA